MITCGVRWWRNWRTQLKKKNRPGKKSREVETMTTLHDGSFIAKARKSRVNQTTWLNNGMLQKIIFTTLVKSLQIITYSDNVGENKLRELVPLRIVKS